MQLLEFKGYTRYGYCRHFSGSDTGNTENIAKMIQKILQKQFGDDVSEVHDIAKSSKEDLEGFDILLLGIPTWYYGGSAV